MHATDSPTAPFTLTRVEHVALGDYVNLGDHAAQVTDLAGVAFNGTEVTALLVSFDDGQRIRYATGTPLAVLDEFVADTPDGPEVERPEVTGWSIEAFTDGSPRAYIVHEGRVIGTIEEDEDRVASLPRRVLFGDAEARNAVTEERRYVVSGITVEVDDEGGCAGLGSPVFSARVAASRSTRVSIAPEAVALLTDAEAEQVAEEAGYLAP